MNVAIYARVSSENSIEELARLADTAGAEVVDKIIQPLQMPSRESYVGSGKLQELLALKETAGYTVLILDDELTPNQQRTLEDTLQVKVIDRDALILDIFARRARTHEGRLQVELAQHQYLLPRLAGQWQHLERLGGGMTSSLLSFRSFKDESTPSGKSPISYGSFLNSLDRGITINQTISPITINAMRHSKL